MTDKVLVESSMVILTSTEFQNFLKQHRLVTQSISGKGGAWQSGAPHMVSTDAQEIAPTTIDFNQSVSLAKFKAAIDRSPFRYSLYHYRRPGQPIGTTIEYNEATDRAAAAAAKTQRPAAQPAIKPTQKAPTRRPYVAYPIDAEKFTGSPITEDPVEITVEIQKTDEGLYYIDYMDKDQGKYSYWRTEGKDKGLLFSAVMPRVRKIESKLERDAAAH